MKKILASLIGFGAPALAFAQTSGFGTGTIGGILQTIFSIMSFLIPMLMVAAIIMFIWGVLQYVIADNEEAKKKGKDHMIWAIVGLFVITAVFGLVSVLKNTFGIGSAPYSVPCPFGDTSAPGPC